MEEQNCNFGLEDFLFNERWKVGFEFTCEGRQALWRKRRAIVSVLKYARVKKTVRVEKSGESQAAIWKE